MKIKSTSLLKLLLMVSFLSTIQIPCLGNYYPNISIFYFVLNVISFFFIIIMLGKIKLNGFTKFIILYFGILVLSTILNKGSIISLIRETICTLTTIIIFDSLDKEMFKKYIGVPVFVLELLTFINLLIIIIYPEGLYNFGFARKYYLFDHVNITIRYLLPGCCLNIIRSYLYNKKIDVRCIAYLVVVGLTLLLTKSSTSLVGFSMFIVCMFLMSKYKFMDKHITVFNVYSIAGLVSYLIIAVNIQQYFSDFIYYVLHKDLTFTGRTTIWQNALDNIKIKPFLGYGRIPLESRYAILNASSAHNQFLILLFEGGLFLLFVTTCLMIFFTKKEKKLKDSKIRRILVSTIFSYFIMWITEPFSYTGTPLMFLVWLILYNGYNLFSDQKSEEIIKK